MVHDVDTVYIALRSRILAGELMPGSVVASDHIEQSFGINDKKVRQVLSSLAGDGYLVRSSTTYKVLGLTHEEVEEWRQILCALFELGVARMILDGDGHSEYLQRHFDKAVSVVPAKDERFYLGALELYGILLGGQDAKLTALANQLVPPMFFRLLWLAEIESGGGAALRQVVSRIIEAARCGRRVRDACQACRTYFDALSAALHRQLDCRNDGTGPDLLGDGERSVERRITGDINYLRTPSAPKQLMPRLPANLAASVKGFLPD